MVIPLSSSVSVPASSCASSVATGSSAGSVFCGSAGASVAGASVGSAGASVAGASVGSAGASVAAGSEDSSVVSSPASTAGLPSSLVASTPFSAAHTVPGTEPVTSAPVSAIINNCFRLNLLNPPIVCKQ